MMQMLQAGGLPALTDGVRADDDDNPRGYLELEAVKRTASDPSWIEQAAGRAVKMVHLLLYDLPAGQRYRVVFMTRNMAEVVRSQAVMLKRRGTSGASLTEDQLVRAYEGQLEKIDRWLAARRNFEVLRVSYNQLVTDPAPLVASVNAFLGGGLDEGAMLLSVDSKLYRQRA